MPPTTKTKPAMTSNIIGIGKPKASSTPKPINGIDETTAKRAIPISILSMFTRTLSFVNPTAVCIVVAY